MSLFAQDKDLLCLILLGAPWANSWKPDHCVSLIWMASEYQAGFLVVRLVTCQVTLMSRQPFEIQTKMSNESRIQVSGFWMEFFSWILFQTSLLSRWRWKRIEPDSRRTSGEDQEFFADRTEKRSKFQNDRIKSDQIYEKIESKAIKVTKWTNQKR